MCGLRWTGWISPFPPGVSWACWGRTAPAKPRLSNWRLAFWRPARAPLPCAARRLARATKAMTAYLPDKPALPRSLCVRDAMELYRDFFADFSEEKAGAMLADLSIGPRDKLSAMSKGTLEKLYLALTMSRKAKLYLLDEPIGGVDPAARDYILSTIIRNYAEDAALVLSTHLIGDIENVLDDALFLHSGRVALAGSVDALRAENGKSVDALFREVFKCSGNY